MIKFNLGLGDIFQESTSYLLSENNEFLLDENDNKLTYE